jgi:hypothetical protein
VTRIDLTEEFVTVAHSTARFHVALSPTDGVDGPNGIHVPQYGS